MRYTTEVELLVDVEVVDAVRGAPATRTTPPEPDEVRVAVWLGPVEVTDVLPVDVLAALEADAHARLEADADEP